MDKDTHAHTHKHTRAQKHTHTHTHTHTSSVRAVFYATSQCHSVLRPHWQIIMGALWCASFLCTSLRTLQPNRDGCRQTTEGTGRNTSWCFHLSPSSYLPPCLYQSIPTSLSFCLWRKRNKEKADGGMERKREKEGRGSVCVWGGRGGTERAKSILSSSRPGVSCSIAMVTHSFHSVFFFLLSFLPSRLTCSQGD